MRVYYFMNLHGYDFEFSVVGAMDEPGVYALVYDGVIWYIGSSLNVKKRINNANHPYRRLWNEGTPVACAVYYTNDFIKLEKELINKVQPILNHQHKAQ